jgi:8-oxo-dGTP pyrophosphatase MutT (NUDIX family)
MMQRDTPEVYMEMRYCHRCGSKLTVQQERHYTCEQGHKIYLNRSPAAGIILLNQANEVLLLERNVEPHRGTFNIPGGVCELYETAEETAMREVLEETQIGRDDYTDMRFVCTDTEPYPYDGQVLPIMVIVFTARLRKDVEPVLDSESVSARFVSLDTFDMDSIRFPGIRRALQRVRDEVLA